MKLHSIHLKNYRCHADLEVHFQSGFNVIVGINGSGKTSLLKGIRDIFLRNFQNETENPLSNFERLIEVSSQGRRYSFEPQYPCSIKLVGKNLDLNLIRKSSSDKFEFIKNEAVATSIFYLRAFYRANRRWKTPAQDELQAATQRNGDLTGYESWWDASLDTKNLQLWVISKCLERFERVSSEAGISFDLVTDDELAVVNMALHEVMSDIKGLRYSITKKRLIVEWQSSPATLFDNLSDGQRSIICLVADIARRMCLLNPQLEMEVIKQTPGIVLIDELDMHLHPQWQRILTNGLQKAFPKVQFIVASHSPQVLGELKPEQIILLRPEGTAHPQVSYGLTSSQVLEEIMGASERSGDVKKRLSELGSTLARNELPAARQHIADLEIEAPGIPELTGAKALLKRKEILGR